MSPLTPITDTFLAWYLSAHRPDLCLEITVVALLIAQPVAAYYTEKPVNLDYKCDKNIPRLIILSLTKNTSKNTHYPYWPTPTHHSTDTNKLLNTGILSLLSPHGRAFWAFLHLPSQAAGQWSPQHRAAYTAGTMHLKHENCHFYKSWLIWIKSTSLGY